MNSLVGGVLVEVQHVYMYVPGGRETELQESATQTRVFFLFLSRDNRILSSTL